MAELLDRLQAALGSAYHLERELGGGGMSRVFVAQETSLGRQVVLKVLPPDLAAGLSIERFRREIQLAASLHHPHIVTLLSAGQADDLLYYTMPLIEGESLRTKLAREGELPVGESIRILRDVTDALVYAHAHGVAHRDIKPDNVLISHNHALVTDFGVAKALSESTGRSSITSVGVALGTPAYMAPEQAAADPHADHRVDLYAVGAMAYEMLTGRPPFTGPTPQSVLAAHVTQRPVPVTESRVAVPPGLAALIMRCLEKKPADRWQRADELCHQLEAMATPSAGMAPTQAAAGTSGRGRPVMRIIAGKRWQRAGYLALGVGLALALAWGVTRYHGGDAAAFNKTVVVLPFENLGRSADEYFADGITEEITNRLTGIRGLKVIARSSAKAYKNTPKPLKQIGQELGAGYVLEGTVRWERVGDTTGRVRVSPELIRVSDGTNLWAHGYDAAIAGVFQMQSDIAEQVAGALDVALGASERSRIETRPTQSTEAYDYYLRGLNYVQHELSQPSLRAAEDLFQRAIALDSSFALAWAYLARVHDNLYWFYFDRTDARRAQVKDAADRAIALQPSNPEGHISLGYYYYHGFLDYEHALAELDTARKLRPNDSELLAAIGFVKRRQGKFEEAFASLSEAAKLAPGSIINLQESAWTAFRLGRFDEVEGRMQRAKTMAPDDPQSGLTLAALAASKGDTGTARRMVAEVLQRSEPERAVTEGIASGNLEGILCIQPDSGMTQLLLRPTLAHFGGDSARYYEWRARVYQIAGRAPQLRAYADSARRILETKVQGRPEDAGFHASLGLAYARLGRKDEAIREGRRATVLLPPSKDAWAGPAYLVNLAEIHTLVGNADDAVEQLGRAFQQGWGELTLTGNTLRYDSRFAPLRSHPRFQRLLGS
jgi:TolB-like protein/Flp pilus assembly protein TadD